MKQLFLAVLAIAVLTIPAFSQETIDHDWGGFSQRENGVIIDVKEELTTEKMGLSGFFTASYGAEIKLATEESKKLLSILYNIRGVANMRYSTYQIQIVVASRFTVAEVEPAIVKAMDDWYQTVTKVE